MGFRDLVLATSGPYQFANAIRYRIRRREQHRIRSPGVARRNCPRFMTEQGRDRQVAIAKVRRRAGEGMPKSVRRDIGGQARKLDDARPMLCQLWHRTAAA